MAGAVTTIARSRPMWTATLVAGAAGAILTLALLGAIGALGSTADRAIVHDAVPTSAPIASAQAVAIAVGRSVVASASRQSRDWRGSGGVRSSSSNEILTSDRLVGSSSKINVTTSDGVVHPARVLGRDATTDLVLLGLDTGVPTLARGAPAASR